MPTINGTVILAAVAAAVSVGVSMGQTSETGEPQTGRRPPSGAGTEGDSAFVQRMMTLDRDRDGFLSEQELPPFFRSRISELDGDRDGRLSRAELAASETSTKESDLSGRKGRAPAGDSMAGQPPMRRAGRGRASATGRGSPLDAEQILKFALSFDVNRDGSLGPEELREYSFALAARRAQARVDREQSSSGASNPTSAGAQTPVPGGVGSAERRSGQGSTAPSASGSTPPPRGLGSDGKGDGGFGDLPKSN